MFLRLLGTVFGALLVESLLYGVHLVLFCICIYILFTQRNPAHMVMLVAITVMFALATADITLSYRFLIHDIPAVIALKANLADVLRRMYPKSPIYVTNNLIADGLLLHRCFTVWGGRKYIVLTTAVLLAAMLLVADSVWGYLSQTMPALSVSVAFTPAYFWSVVAFNIIVTIATAGRIWWMAHIERPILGRQQVWRYDTAIAMLLESGAIYSISVLLAVAIPLTKDYRLIFLTCAVRIVGIMPTLMIMQVEFGRSSEKKQDGTTSTVLYGTTDNIISIPVTFNDDTAVPSYRPFFNHMHLPTASDGHIPEIKYSSR